MSKITQEQNAKKKKNSASIEQMCGILLLSMEENTVEKVHRELEGVLKRIREAEPCGHLDVKRIDRKIISSLRRIAELVKKPDTVRPILELSADIGLLLLQRSVRAKA